MTPDERNMLADLANKIAQTPAPPRDPDAEEFIRRSIGTRPDALYLMTQTVLIQNMALQQSQHQIQELQQRLSQPAPAGYPGGGGSFLGGSAPSGYGQQQYGQNPQYQAAPPAYAPQTVAPPPSGMSGFLRGAAQTAAGVAAGTLAIQGIESLFTHHSGFGGGEGLFGGGGIGGYGGGGGETIIENNYYGDPQSGQNERFADSGDKSSVDLGPQDDDYQAGDDNYDANAVDDSSYDDLSGGNDDNFA
jgi:hypothetical protein